MSCALNLKNHCAPRVFDDDRYATIRCFSLGERFNLKTWKNYTQPWRITSENTSSKTTSNDVAIHVAFKKHHCYLSFLKHFKKAKFQGLSTDYLLLTLEVYTIPNFCRSSQQHNQLLFTAFTWLWWLFAWFFGAQDVLSPMDLEVSVQIEPWLLLHFHHPSHVAVPR